MKYEDGSCPDVSGGTQASMWTVNRDDQGAYAVTVQGDDKLPSLTGKEDGSYVVLTGVAGSSPGLLTQWRMSGSASELKGRALQTRSSPKAIKVKGVFGEIERDALCSVIWSVEAVKQGK